MKKSHRKKKNAHLPKTPRCQCRPFPLLRLHPHPKNAQVKKIVMLRLRRPERMMRRENADRQPGQSIREKKKMRCICCGRLVGHTDTRELPFECDALSSTHYRGASNPSGTNSVSRNALWCLEKWPLRWACYTSYKGDKIRGRGIPSSHSPGLARCTELRPHLLSSSFSVPITFIVIPRSGALFFAVVDMLSSTLTFIAPLWGSCSARS